MLFWLKKTVISSNFWRNPEDSIHHQQLKLNFSASSSLSKWAKSWTTHRNASFIHISKCLIFFKSLILGGLSLLLPNISSNSAIHFSWCCWCWANENIENANEAPTESWPLNWKLYLCLLIAELFRIMMTTSHPWMLRNFQCSTHFNWLTASMKVQTSLMMSSSVKSGLFSEISIM